jgi:diketogulonate reductase-like aldo/keto reductase
MAINSIADRAKLNNGVEIAWLGLGTYQTPPGRSVEQAVRWALDAGYRHIDTAALYQNEGGIGKAIRESGIPRDQIFITTKVWNDDIRRIKIAAAIDASLKRLGTDYVDLYLLHWPIPGEYVTAWRSMEKILAQKKARSIGVSNYLLNHLTDLLPRATVIPAVNQVEWHPYLLQKNLLNFCAQKGILFQAWAPLMQGQIAEVSEVQKIAQSHQKSPAQIAIRWGFQHGVNMIPKSVRKERIEENAQVFDFELTPEDMQTIDSLDRQHRIGPDPNNFNF